jgi:hypothetical protein
MSPTPPLPPLVTATLGGAPLMPFTTCGIAPRCDGAVVGFSANTAVAGGKPMCLRYERNISDQDSARALTAGVRMSWSRRRALPTVPQDTGSRRQIALTRQWYRMS